MPASNVSLTYKVAVTQLVVLIYSELICNKIVAAVSLCASTYYR